jgi:hypothetical protein
VWYGFFEFGSNFDGGICERCGELLPYKFPLLVIMFPLQYKTRLNKSPKNVSKNFDLLGVLAPFSPF